MVPTILYNYQVLVLRVLPVSWLDKYIWWKVIYELLGFVTDILLLYGQPKLDPSHLLGKVIHAIAENSTTRLFHDMANHSP